MGAPRIASAAGRSIQPVREMRMRAQHTLQLVGEGPGLTARGRDSERGTLGQRFREKRLKLYALGVG